jgi:hypothetical protein
MEVTYSSETSVVFQRTIRLISQKIKLFILIFSCKITVCLLKDLLTTESLHCGSFMQSRIIFDSIGGVHYVSEARPGVNAAFLRVILAEGQLLGCFLKAVHVLLYKELLKLLNILIMYCGPTYLTVIWHGMNRVDFIIRTCQIPSSVELGGRSCIQMRK